MNISNPARLAALISILSLNQCHTALATCGGGGGGGIGGIPRGNIFQVPWRPAGPSPDRSPINEGLLVYWFPASPSEFPTSSLRYSRLLAFYGRQCVRMIVGSVDSQIGQKLLGTDSLPEVVITTADGTILGKVQGQQGAMRVDQSRTITLF